MLSLLFESFIVIVYFTPISSYMNLLRDSFFRISNNKNYKRLNQPRPRNSGFRQANNSFIDPSLYTFENADIELDTIDSDPETQSNNEPNLRTRSSRENNKPSAQNGGSIVIVEKPVVPNETIQAFAIRYRVPVSIKYLSLFSI